MDVLSIWLFLLALLGFLTVLRIIIGIVSLFSGKKMIASELDSSILILAAIVFLPIFIIFKVAKKH